MEKQNEWDRLADYYETHTPEIVGEVIRPEREITLEDLDDIFAGRPLAETPREKATIPRKTYLTPTMDEQVRKRAKEEHIGMAALIRKALANYLATA